MNLSGAYTACADESDIEAWEAMGRGDILKWVAYLPLGENSYVYDIWLDPKTGEDVNRCPWLRKLPKKDKYVCRIHEVKPRHCKEYQISQQHAGETGCKGVD